MAHEAVFWNPQSLRVSTDQTSTPLIRTYAVTISVQPEIGGSPPSGVGISHVQYEADMVTELGIQSRGQHVMSCNMTLAFAVI